jgi:hypothetical protein
MREGESLNSANRSASPVLGLSLTAFLLAPLFRFDHALSHLESHCHASGCAACASNKSFRIVSIHAESEGRHREGREPFEEGECQVCHAFGQLSAAFYETGAEAVFHSPESAPTRLDTPAFRSVAVFSGNAFPRAPPFC